MQGTSPKSGIGNATVTYQHSESPIGKELMSSLASVSEIKFAELERDIATIDRYLTEKKYNDAYDLCSYWAIDCNNPLTWSRMGILYEKGWGVEKDVELARGYFEKAAATGDPTALFCMGSLLSQSEYPLEKKSATFYYESVIKQCRLLKSVLENGKEAKHVAACASACASYTSIEGQANLALGLMYYKGNGVGEDVVLALSYFADAAFLGRSEALIIMGNIFALGEGGVVVDYGRAIDCFMMASDTHFDVVKKCIGRLVTRYGNYIDIDDLLWRHPRLAYVMGQYFTLMESSSLSSLLGFTDPTRAWYKRAPTSGSAADSQVIANYLMDQGYRDDSEIIQLHLQNAIAKRDPDAKQKLDLQLQREAWDNSLLEWGNSFYDFINIGGMFDFLFENLSDSEPQDNYRVKEKID